MSIASAIQNAQQKVADAYTAISNKGGTLPATQDLANMPNAISSISTTNLTTLNITQNGTYTPQSPYNGFSSVTANITSGLLESIMQNVVDGNNPVDVTTLQTVENNIHSMLPIEIEGSFRTVVNGVFRIPEAGDNFEFKLPSNATDLGDYAMYRAFYGYDYVAGYSVSNLGITSVDLSSLITISGNNALDTTFYGCSNITSVDLSNLTTVSGNNALSYAFYRCIGLSGNLDLSSLTTVTGSLAFNYCFTGFTGSAITSVDFSNLTTVTGESVFLNCFDRHPITSVDLSSLTTVTGKWAFQRAFRRTSLTSLSFPALTSNSFGSYTNQFNEIILGVSNCVVHFPSNLQSVIGSWDDVIEGFGGTNTTVLFDLPATT